ncbi:MAG: type I-E CRISPR-associated protein Cas7/Cse4/CasC, partial [Myxococcota bacterium]
IAASDLARISLVTMRPKSAAIHVAHAFTVHEQDSEDDYFSAVDDLVQEAGGQGSGHINSSELTSGLYYGYVVVDVPLLVSNLTGCDAEDWESADRRVAAEIVSRLIHLICTVSPGAKLGSTAPYSRAHWVMVEAGVQQPRSLANAFMNPVPSRGDVLHATYGQLVHHVEDLDRMYSGDEDRVFAALGADELLGSLGKRMESLTDVRHWAAGRVQGEA